MEDIEVSESLLLQDFKKYINENNVFGLYIIQNLLQAEFWKLEKEKDSTELKAIKDLLGKFARIGGV